MNYQSCFWFTISTFKKLCNLKCYKFCDLSCVKSTCMISEYLWATSTNLYLSFKLGQNGKSDKMDA